MCQGCCVQVRESIYQVSCCIGYLDNIKYILRHTWYSKLCNRWYGYNIIYIHSLFDTQYTMHIYIYIYIYIKCIFHFTGICSVLEGWLITVLMMFNVFLYGQSPNPQYGGSGGDGDHVYRHMQCIYIYIYLWPSVWWSPLPHPRWWLSLYVYEYYIYIYLHYIYIFIYFFIYTHVFVSIRM